jgi:hypothetical protein
LPESTLLDFSERKKTCLAIRVFAGGETGIRSADAIPQ